jgi:hypothetical protein
LCSKLTIVSGKNEFSAFPLFFLHSGNFPFSSPGGHTNLASLINQKVCCFLKKQNKNMKFEALKAKKFQTSENANMNKLFGGNATTSFNTTNFGTRRDTFADADFSGSGSGTSSVSNINGVVTFDA